MSERETLEKLVDDYERVVMERSLISVFNSEAKARNATKHADIRSRLLAALLREDEGEPAAWWVEYESAPGVWRYFDVRLHPLVRGETSFSNSPLRARPLILPAPQPREELRPPTEEGEMSREGEPTLRFRATWRKGCACPGSGTTGRVVLDVLPARGSEGETYVLRASMHGGPVCDTCDTPWEPTLPRPSLAVEDALVPTGDDDTRVGT